MRASAAAHLRRGGAWRAARPAVATAAPCALFCGDVAAARAAAGAVRTCVISAVRFTLRLSSSAARPPRSPPTQRRRPLPLSPPLSPSSHRSASLCRRHGRGDAEARATARFTSSLLSPLRARHDSAWRGRSRKGRTPVRPSSAPLRQLQCPQRQRATALTPLERRLCALVAGGAWRDALEVLHSANPSDATEAQHHAAENRQDRSAASSSPSSSSVAPEEVCAWLLLWGGHSSPAWQLWGAMHADLGATTATASGASAAGAAPSSPRLLLLLLALFTRLVERDAVRTRDALLVFELTQPHHRGDPDGNTEVRLEEARLRFLARWLSCCTDALDICRGGDSASRATEDLRAFTEEAVHRLTVSSSAGVGPHVVAEALDAETVALLLLSLHDALRSGGSAEGPGQLRDALLSACRQEGGSACGGQRGSESGTAAVALVAATVAEVLFHDSPPTSRDTSAAVSTNAKEDRAGVAVGLPSAAAAATAASEERRTAVRRALASALQVLPPHANHWTTLTSAASDAATARGLLTCYRFWLARFLRSDGELAPVWMALQGALERRASAPSGVATPQPRERQEPHHASPQLPTPQPLRALLRRIERVTDEGEWAVALRLCLGDADVSAPASAATAAAGHAAAADAPRCPSRAAADPFPWRRRLRKGLTACEAARPASAAWRGALALWHYARSHMDDSHGTDAPQRELGRVFALLARATRWAEALACFYDTPDSCLDCFVVAHVMYALRASPARHDRAALDVWAAWRCRCGDAALPTADMTHQLLGAMLHTSGAPAALPALSSVSPAAPADVAAEVSTRLLIAASEPGAAAVPLDWTRERHAVRQIVQDRWAAGWSDALRVALASGDADLLVRTVAPRVPAAHPPGLFAEVSGALRERGVTLTPADRVALLALWTPRQQQHQTQRPHGDDEEVGVAGTTNDAALAGRGRVRQKVLAAEAMLDELLGLR